MADWRNRLTREVSGQLEKHFKSKVLNTIIPRNVRLAEAPSYGQSIVDYDIKSIGGEAFLSLSGEFIRRFEHAKKKKRLTKGWRLCWGTHPNPKATKNPN